MKEKGITLIALVITIIILLILAGISIATLMGDNGLINKAKKAEEQTKIESIKEEIRIEILGKQVENEGKVTEETVKEILEEYGILSQEEEKLLDKTLTTNEGKYEIKVSDIWNGTTVKDIPKEPTETKVANEPDISGFDHTKTYYVAWDLNETKTEYITNEKKISENKAPNNWYDYKEGVNEWANVKTAGGGNDCYWVWIPRYAYKITYTNSENRENGTIDVIFLKDQSNNDMNGKDVTSSSYKDAKGNIGAYIVHPAFTTVGNGQSITNPDGSINTNYVGNGGFGELTGIWVAKFEASSSSVSVVENPTVEQLAINGGVTTNDKDMEGKQLTNIDLKVRIKPNVTSWRDITLGNIFTVCKNLTLAGNSLENTNHIDSHLMKNTEWGACVYLSRSAYGKKDEVWNNPYYNNTTNYSPITGLCGKGANDENLSTTSISSVCKYNEIGAGKASTTGNVYGIYDMRGGAWEYVAGILSSYKSMNDNYDFSNQGTYPNQYFDWYAGNSSDRNINYRANKGKYGDAVYETSISGYSDADSWNGSISNFPNSSYPVFLRGSRAFDGSHAGMFAFGHNLGIGSVHYSFRPVILKK